MKRSRVWATRKTVSPSGIAFMESLNFQNDTFVLSNIALGKEADMRSTFIAATLTTLSILSIPSPVLAQDSKVARGTVAAIAGQSLTVKVGDESMQFNVDSKTMVEARGRPTKS